MNREYLEAIKSKLDALNRVSGGKTSGKKSSGEGAFEVNGYEPELMDPFEAQGHAALKWLASQKSRNENS